MKTLAAVILAAGQGTRMKSRIPKILHKVGGQPMVAHVFKATNVVTGLKPVLVVNPEDKSVQELFGHDALYVDQAEQLGTGHAALMAKPLLEGKSEQVIVTYADMPLIRAETFSALADLQNQTSAVVAMLSVIADDGSSFGRVVRDTSGQVKEIVEVAQAKKRPDADALLSIGELNVGVYCFASGWLWANLTKLPKRQARSGQEYYLTDLVELAVRQEAGVEAVLLEDANEALGAGSRAELGAVDKAFRQRVNHYWLSNGVTILDPATTYIDGSVSIEPDTTIWPNTYIEGDSAVGPNCILGPNAMIRNAQISQGCHIENSVVEGSSLEKDSFVTAFSHIKDNKRI